MSHTDIWEFPLPRTHTGILQGNGLLGVMIWGEENVLRITVNRADFWDRRGGKPWVDGMSYANIRRLREAGDEEGLRALFEQGETATGQPERPSLLPCGRIELVLESIAAFQSGLDQGPAQGRPLGSAERCRLRENGYQRAVLVTLDEKVGPHGEQNPYVRFHR